MAKLKLWVRNLIISLVLVLSIAGVGVGLYFVFKQTAKTDPEHERQLTPEQQEFILHVKDNPQVDADYDVYNSLVVTDGTSTSALAISDIVAKSGNYFVTEIGGYEEIYKLISMGSAAEPITLEKIDFGELQFLNVASINGNYCLSGDYAILEKADHSLVLVSLLTGEVVFEEDVFNVYDVDEDDWSNAHVAELVYFGNNFLIVNDSRVTRYESQTDFDAEMDMIVYNLGKTDAPIVFDLAEEQLIHYEITEDYAELVTTKKTVVYSAHLNEQGELQQLLPEFVNTAVETTSDEDAVATYMDKKYSKLEFATVQFVPDTNFVLIEHAQVAKTEDISVDDYGTLNDDTVDGAYQKTLTIGTKLVKVKYQMYDAQSQSYVAGFKISGAVEALKSSVENYIELVSYQTYAAYDFDLFSAHPTAHYYDNNFNLMVEYRRDISGDIIYYADGVYYTSGENGVESIDVWGERTMDLNAYTIVSQNVYGSVVLAKGVSTGKYKLYNIATKQLYSTEYDFATQIQNGKIIVHITDFENHASGFYLIDLATMKRTAIADFDVTCVNLVAGSVGIYFTYDGEKYTLHSTKPLSSGTYKIENITSYSFSSMAEEVDETKIPTTIGGSVFIELTIDGQAQKTIVVAQPMTSFMSLSNAEAFSKYPVEISDESEIALLSATLHDKGVEDSMYFIEEDENSSDDIHKISFDYQYMNNDIWLMRTFGNWSGYAANVWKASFSAEVDVSGDVPVHTLSATGYVDVYIPWAVTKTYATAGFQIGFINPSNLDKTKTEIPFPVQDELNTYLSLNKASDHWKFSGDDQLLGINYVYTPSAFIIVIRSQCGDGHRGGWYTVERIEYIVGVKNGYYVLPNSSETWLAGMQTAENGQKIGYNANQTIPAEEMNSSVANNYLVVGNDEYSVSSFAYDTVTTDGSLSYQCCPSMTLKVAPYVHEMTRVYEKVDLHGLGSNEGSWHLTNQSSFDEGNPSGYYDKFLRVNVKDKGYEAFWSSSLKNSGNYGVYFSVDNQYYGSGYTVVEASNASFDSPSYRPTAWWENGWGGSPKSIGSLSSSTSPKSYAREYTTVIPNYWWYYTPIIYLSDVAVKITCPEYVSNKIMVPRVQLDETFAQSSGTTTAGFVDYLEFEWSGETTFSTAASPYTQYVYDSDENPTPVNKFLYGFTKQAKYGIVGENRRSLNLGTDNLTKGYSLEGYYQNQATSYNFSNFKVRYSWIQVGDDYSHFTYSDNNLDFKDELIKSPVYNEIKNSYFPNAEVNSNLFIIGGVLADDSYEWHIKPYIYPRYVPNTYKVVYHYADKTYNRNELLYLSSDADYTRGKTAQELYIDATHEYGAYKLPLNNNAADPMGSATTKAVEISNDWTSQENNKHYWLYNKTYEQSVTYNTSSEYFWPTNNAGSVAQYTEPYGYDFEYWYAPKDPTSVNDKSVTIAEKVRTVDGQYHDNSKIFGQYYTASGTNLEKNFIDSYASTKHKRASEEGKEDSKVYEIHLYAIYTLKKYDLQLDLKDHESQDDQLHVYKGNDIWADGTTYTISSNFDLNTVYGINVFKPLPIAYVSDGKTYKQAIAKRQTANVVGTGTESDDTRTDINLSFESQDNRKYATDYWWLAAYTDFFSGEDVATRKIFINCDFDTPMNYGVMLKNNINSANMHVYDSSTSSKVNVNLITPQFANDGKFKEITGGYQTDEGDDKDNYWKSGLASTLVYENFAEGLKVDIDYKFYDQKGKQQTVSAEFGKTRTFAAFVAANNSGTWGMIPSPYVEREYWLTDDPTNPVNTDKATDIAILFDLSDDDTLTIYFVNYHGMFDYEIRDEQIRGKFAVGNIEWNGNNTVGKNAVGTIEIDATFSSLPYELNVENNGVIMPYTDGDGRPVAVTKLNSLSEVDNTNKEARTAASDQQLAFGSTVLVNIGAGLYKRLYTKAYVPNSYVAGFTLNYGATEIASFYNSDYMAKLAIELGLITKDMCTETGNTYTVPDTNIKIYMMTNKGAMGTNVIASDQLQALLICMYGEGKTNIDDISADNPLFYAMLPIMLPIGNAYLISIKYDGVVEGNNDNSELGIATALMFNINEKWTAGENGHSYNLVIDEQTYAASLDYRLDASNMDDDEEAHSNIEFDKGRSYLGYGADGPQDMTGMSDDELAEYFAGTGDTKLAPADYLTFNISTDEGYYVDTITVVLNDKTYVLTLEKIVVDATTDRIVPTYKLLIDGVDSEKTYEGVVSEPENDIGDRVENYLLYARILDFAPTMPRQQGERNAQKIVLHIGYIHDDASITVKAKKYTIVRFASSWAPTSYDSNEFSYVQSGNVISIRNSDQIAKMTFVGADGAAVADYFVLGTSGGGINYQIITSDNSTTDMLVFAKGYAVSEISNYIVVESTLSTQAGYVLAVAENGKQCTSSVAEIGIETIDTSTTKKVVTNTYTYDDDGNKQNTKNIAGFMITPKFIDTTIKSDIDFGGGAVSHIYEETTGTVETGKQKMDENTFYQLNGNGQVASNDTQIIYKSGNYEQASGNKTKYDNYGHQYSVYANGIQLQIHEQYGYVFDGLTLWVKFDGETDVVYEANYTNTAQSGLIECKVYNGEDWHVVGQYKIAEPTSEENYYQFELVISNLLCYNFEIKLHYHAKTFDVTYDKTINPDGTYSGDVDGDIESRMFVYNVKSDVNTGTSWIASNDSERVGYSRVGYDHIGWAFATSYFTKNNIGKTNHVAESDYYNGKSEGYEYPSGISTGNLLFKVNGDAGYAWYLALSQIYLHIFDTDELTMYAIWNAKTYSIALNFNDATKDNGSTNASKFMANWVFDTQISGENIAGDDLTFTDGTTMVNAISNTYRMGYTFDGWYYTSGFDTTCVYKDIGNPQFEGNSNNFDNTTYGILNAAGAWNETAQTVSLYSKWTANQYKLLFDTNSGYVNVGKNYHQYIIYDRYAQEHIVFSDVIGVGSSVGTLVESEQYVTFDQPIGEIFSYAYRYGYQFAGWYETRFGNAALAETKTLNLNMLTDMINKIDNTNTSVSLVKTGTVVAKTDDELALLKYKVVGVSATNTNAVDTLEQAGADNVILLHARWSALEYTFTVDLNNENHIDYAWNDSDYMVGGVEIGPNKHLVGNNILNFKLKFDDKFETGDLYVNDIKVSSGYKFERYGKQITLSGDGYNMLLQVLYSYGYELGIAQNQTTTFHFGIIKGEQYGNGFVLENQSNVNADQLFESDRHRDAVFENETDSFEVLTDIDLSGHDEGDRHKTNVDDAEKFGQRKLTMFAYWTPKTINPENDKETSTSESYANNLTDATQEDQYVDYVYGDISGETLGDRTDVKYDKNSAVETTIKFFAPTGKYAKTLTLNLYSTDNENTFMGSLVLTFSWDSALRKTIIESARVYDRTGAYTILSLSGTDTSKTYNEFSNLQYIAHAIAIETSQYICDQNGLNYWDTNEDINTKYNDWLFDGNMSQYNSANKIKDQDQTNYDINVISIIFTSLKSKIKVVADTFGQTYQVDYYRYIRPLDGSTTKLEQDDIEQLGEESWESEFYNDWNQYLVYQTITYRYGEYANMNYGYASNFTFENWYYYQGHLYNFDSYDDYANYAEAGHIYQTDDHNFDSRLDHLLDVFGLWEAIVYDWNEDLHRYVHNGSSEDYIDFGGQKVNDQDSVTIHKYTWTAQEEDNKKLVAESFEFDRRPVRGNTSLICLYVPSAKHSVHYYSWNESGGYSDRTPSSNQYVLGEKRVFSVSDLRYNSVETWVLGNNEEYYYVGFSGINKLDVNGTPTREAALAFLLQFVNSTVEECTYDASHNVWSIDWFNFSSAILSGVTLNGTTYSFGGSGMSSDSSPEEVAAYLERMLVQHYSDPTLFGGNYGFNGSYLCDIVVVQHLSFYDEIKDIIEAIEVPTGDDPYEQLEYKKKIFTVVYNHVTNKTEESVDITRAHAEEVVEKLGLADVAILLDQIAVDYFGFILKNPTSVISSFPGGDSTYFAGWYLIDSNLKDFLDNHPNYALTFNSSTWPASASYQTLTIVSENYHPEDGTTTYTLEAEDKQFEVSKFRTIDQITNVIDKLSRVNNDVFVYAAFNFYKFEFNSQFELTQDDLQWGSPVADLNGDPYQYEVAYAGAGGDYKTGIKIVALNDDAYSEFIKQIVDNNNIPTSLNNVINGSIGECKDLSAIEYFTAIKDNVGTDAEKIIGYKFDVSAESVEAALGTGSWHLIAYTVNIKKIEYATGGKLITYNTEPGKNNINMCSTNMIVWNNGEVSIVETGK